MKLLLRNQDFLIWPRPYVKKSYFNLIILLLLTLFTESSYAQAPVPPPGTNLQSWMGNTFSVFTDLDLQERVPEELQDIKLGNGVLFFAGYHERGGGGASFNTSNGSFAGRYGFNTGFGSPAKSVAADANNVYYGLPDQGIQKFVYGGSDEPIGYYLPGKSISGLCIKNGKMYISNWTDSKIHVYNVSTMTEDASWMVTNPTRLTVDSNGKIWVIQWDPTSLQGPMDGPVWNGKNILSYSNTGVQGASITNFEKPTSIGVDGSGLLLVGGLNEHSQIWKYGNLTSTPTQVGTFGVLNGIFSGTPGEYTNTAKLHWISGIDVDATGNIYVACRYGTFWGAAIEKFSPSGALLWRNFCGSSLDGAGIDPENDTEVYSKYHHYSLDYSKTTPGSEWSLKGFTVNRFKYPQDYRVDFLNDVGERALGQGVVRIQGRLFAMRSHQSQYDLELYRFDPANDGEVSIPSVIFQGGNDGILTFNPGTGNWVTTTGNTNYKQYWDISSNGDVYSLANITTSYSHLVKFPFQGFDSNSNPIYNGATTTTTPIPGNSTYRASGLSFDEATDCVYLIASRNIDADGENRYIRCIQNVNATPTEKWTVNVPFDDIQYTPGTNFGGGRVIAIDVAGDYVFLAYGYGHIRILNKLTGALVGTLTQNMNGWIGTEGQIDAKCGINVTKRSNGEYVVLFENATMGNIQMHRWNPGSTTTVAPTVSTTVVSLITSTSASSGGNVTAAGSSAVTARGVVWGTTANPTVALTTKTTDGSGTGIFTSSITGLTAGTTYNVRAYATNSVGTSYGSNLTVTTTGSTTTAPTVSTTAVSLITSTSASSGGNVTAAGSSAVTARGVVWSTTANPTVALTTKTTDGSGAGIFTSSITGLTAGTTYNVRAYATNSAGTSYGSNLTFTTTVITTTAPTVSTTAVSLIASTSASSGGNVTAAGSSAVTARGVVWSTTANPTVALTTKTTDGSGTGIFTSSITGLTANTAYNVRAYATNSVGTSYGSNLTFTTNAATGGSIVREVWSNITGTAVSAIPLTTSPTSTSNISSLEGPTNSADNYGARIRAFITPATNGSYTFYIAGDDNCELWLSTNDSPANKVKIASVTGWTSSREWTKFPTTQTSTARSLTAGTKYYVEVLHKEAGGGDNVAVGWTGPGIPTITVISGSVLSPYTTTPPTTTAPIVTTTVISAITSTSASSGGNVTADGGASVTARGVVWGTTANPTVALATKTTNGSGTGTYASSITGLTANTTYNVRAYATNSAGTSYGSNLTFTYFVGTETTTIIENTASGWTWSGYTLDLCSTCSGGSAHSSPSNGHFGQRTFSGTKLEAYCETYDGAGSIEIFIDNVSKGVFSQWITPYGGATLFATISNLTQGVHTVKFVQNSNMEAGIDYLRITGNPSAASRSESMVELETSLDKVSVYPNPSNTGFVTIDFNGEAETAQVDIIDLMGKRVYGSGKLSNVSKVTVGTHAYSSGTYIIRVSKGKQMVNRKLIVGQ